MVSRSVSSVTYDRLKQGVLRFDHCDPDLRARMDLRNSIITLGP
jgi:hypothetical protein